MADKKLKFFAYRYADVSTGYLEDSDLDKLKPGAPHHLAELDNKEGDVFHIPSEEYDEYDGSSNFIKELAEYGFSEKFLHIMREARRQGYRYIRFDSCGMAVKGIKRRTGISEPLSWPEENGEEVQLG